jgi:glucose/arabinose dehydrogenase
MMFYTGSLFSGWRGDAIISGLQSRGLVRVRIDPGAATEVQRINLDARIRSVVQGPDGAIWVLEDYPSGRLLKLTPST